ncbi:MAG: hypothetical protein SGARI_000373 [Bacillariaceae sp.]
MHLFPLLLPTSCDFLSIPHYPSSNIRCSHCKKIEKDWDNLAKKWNGHEIGLVAEVDCTDNETGAGKQLCKHLGIESYPTLKYGDPYDLEEYEGGRSFKELDDFAKANLVPVCSLESLDLCEPEMRQRLEKFLKMDKEELKALMAEEETKMEMAEKEFQEFVDSLTEKYEAAEKERRNAIDAVNNGELPAMRQVLAAREADGEIIDEKDAGRSANEEL